MTSASPVIVESASPAPQHRSVMPGPPPARGDELGPNGRRVLIGTVIAVHVVGGWALLQIDAVRNAVREVAPVLMVNMIAPPEPPKAAPPPPPAQPKRVAPAPAPIIAAAPSPTPTATAFVAPPPDPTPPAPVAVAAPPAPPAAAPAPPAVVTGPKQVPPSAVRYVKLPDLHFPALSRRAREEGTVVLRITVDISGHLKHATVHRSSGFERIDGAALKDIQSARFAPQTEDGKPVEWQTLAPLAYEL